MIQVRRLGHATFSTGDMAREIDYWSNILGLVVTDKSKDRVFMATKHGHEVVTLVPGPAGELKRLAFIAAPAVLAGGVVQINLLVGRQVASYTDGAVSWLVYADRLYQLPLGVVGIAMLHEGELIALGTVDEIRCSKHPIVHRFLNADFNPNHTQP